MPPILSSEVLKLDELELTPLKKVYDELWCDAKTMIKDMNANIKMVFFFLLVFIFFSEINSERKADAKRMLNPVSLAI